MKRMTKFFPIIFPTAIIILLLVIMQEVASYRQNVLMAYGWEIIVQMIFLVGLTYIWIKRIVDPANRNKYKKAISVAGWGIYIIALYIVLFRDVSLTMLSDINIGFYIEQLKIANFIPFQVFLDYSKYSNKVSYFIQLFGNIVMFIPFGILTPIVIPKMNKTYFYVIITLLCIVMIEVIQFMFVCGNFDIDDVLLNYLGALLSFGIYKFATNVHLK